MIGRIDLRQLKPAGILRTMVAMRTWALGFMVCAIAACGVVEAPPEPPVAVDPQRPADPDPAPTAPAPVPELEACAAMDCDFFIGESCPVCGTPELTCACYKLKGDGSDEVGVPCAPADAQTCI